MDVFLSLLSKLIPLYVIIALGFIAEKYLEAKKETVAKLLIYIIVPAVMFYGTATAKLTASNLSLPILFFVIASVLCLAFLKIGKRFYGSDKTKNILAFTAGAANVGYFGLPVAMILFSKSLFGLAVLSILGISLYESTVGYFVTANGSHSVKDSLAKTAKMPAIYAFLLGLAVNLLDIHLGANVTVVLDYFKSGYTLLGMMLVGMGLSCVNLKSFDPEFLSLSFLAKFVVWPAVIGAIIFLDSHFFRFYSEGAYQIMILFSVVPLAANTVAYASEFKTCPDKASLAVLLSTVFALFYVPLAVALFIN